MKCVHKFFKVRKFPSFAVSTPKTLCLNDTIYFRIRQHLNSFELSRLRQISDRHSANYTIMTSIFVNKKSLCIIDFLLNILYNLYIKVVMYVHLIINIIKVYINNTRQNERRKSLIGRRKSVGLTQKRIIQKNTKNRSNKTG